MQLPTSDRHDDCECAEIECAQCETAIGNESHYRAIEAMDFSTMEFVDIGPMHMACVRYRMLGFCSHLTRQARAGAAGLN